MIGQDLPPGGFRPASDDASTRDLAERLEHAPPGEILRWAADAFGGRIVATSSFQSQSVPLLHLIGRYAPEIPVVFLDTGFHFPETLAFRDRLAAEFGIEVRTLRTRMGHDAFAREHGLLHRTDPDLCCHLNKVEPLEDALAGADAWVAGIRRDQTAQRADIPVVTREPDGTVKICPLATWTERDVWRYLHDHDLPEHPLLREGYLSIGCAPCTRAVGRREDARAGRWSGSGKTECGLHTRR